MSVASPVRLFHRDPHDCAQRNSIEPSIKREETRHMVKQQKKEQENTTITSDSNNNSHGYRSDVAGIGMWTEEEHARFLEALRIFTNGPWKRVAAYVGTRNVRQTMTHAQKYRQKATRHLRGLRSKQALRRLQESRWIGEAEMLHDKLGSKGTKDGLSLSSEAYKRQTASLSHKHTSQDKKDSTTSGRAVTIKEALGILNEGNFQTENNSPSDTDSSITSGSCIVAESEVVPYSKETPEPDIEMEIEILDDLDGCPTLEECAEELVNLLF